MLAEEEGTQEVAYTPAVAHQSQEASAVAVAVVETLEGVQNPAGESPAVPHTQPAKAVVVAVIPKEGEGAGYWAAAEAEEQNYSPHLHHHSYGPRTQEA